MSSSILTRLRNFSVVLKNANKYCYVPCHSQILNQQVNSCRFPNFHREIHLSYLRYLIHPAPKGEDPNLYHFNLAFRTIQKAVKQIDDEALTNVANWHLKVLEYNVRGGKQIRGLTVLKSFRTLSEVEPSLDKIEEACILGWCVELLQGFFLICDDIMDRSITRRGKPCWYRMPHVGMMAINDALLLECTIYKILEMHFKNHEAYNDILHEFLRVTRKTVYGQTLDMMNTPSDGEPRVENFTMERYQATVEHKTSHYTFCLPVHLAMFLTGQFSEEEFELTREICLKLGLLFQIQDDHIDLFGDPDVTGKIGTDISDGKCTWFVCTFFACAPKHMKKSMMAHYATNDEDSVSEVIKMYKELHMEEKFLEYEQKLMQEITTLIESLPKESLQTLFHSLLKVVYQRQK